MNHVAEMGVVAGKRMIEKAKTLNVAMFERTENTTVEEMVIKLETRRQSVAFLPNDSFVVRFGACEGSAQLRR